MFAFPYIPRPDTGNRARSPSTLRSVSGLILVLAVAAVGFVALAP